MLRTRKRWISLLVTLAMLVTFAVPFVGPAAAYTGIKALTVPNVSDNDWQNVGDVVIEVDGGALAAGDSLTLTLPDDFKFVEDADKYSVTRSTYEIQITDTSTEGKGDIVIETPSSYAGNDNELTADMLDVSVLSEDQIQIQVKDPYKPISGADEAIIKVVLNKIWIKDGASGDVVLTVEKPSDSAFPSGDVVIARVPGGLCELSVPSVDTFSDSKVVKFRLKETTTGSLEKDTESLKLSLPNGFEWAKLETGDYGTGYTLINDGYVAAKKIWGDTIGIKSVTVNDDKDELTFDVENESSDKAAYYEFVAKIIVSDETEAEEGDVTVTVGGESDVNVDSFVIATYGEYGVKIEADDPETTIVAGMLDQDASDINIKETVAGSLVKDRTIVLTLPDNAKWTKVDTNGDSDNGCEVDFVGPVGDDGRSIKYKVVSASTDDAAELTLEDFQVAVEPGFTGDLKVTVSGTAGLSDEIVIGKVVAPITATASSTPDVKIGLGSQPAGDLIITETAAGNIKEDEYIIVDLPTGVSFANVPTVTVTSGDLKIDQSTVKTVADGDTADNQLKFEVSNDSSKASTIKISNIYLTVDRTVPEGDIKVDIKGAAVAETADVGAIEDYFNNTFGTAGEITVSFGGQEAYTLNDEDLFFPNTTSAASAVIAKCVTPAPGETKGVAVFKIGQASYTLNGATVTMDVAPYIKDGRTMVPVRFAANAVGVSDANILWDAASKKVTVIKGDRVIQMTIGSNVMTINGAAITMDTAPEIKDGRTMLPIRFLGQALGAEFIWDEATQTVTVNF